MSTLQEMARLVREELLTLIQPVQLLSVNPTRATGEVSGRFRSSGMLFDYSIKGGRVSYKPLGAGGRKDSADEASTGARAASPARRAAYLETRMRLDAAKKKCVKGFSCGNTCIPKGRQCRVKGGQAAAKLEQMAKMLPAAGQTAGSPAPQRKAAASKEPAAKGKAAAPGKGPTLREARGEVLSQFGAKTVNELKKDKNFQMAMSGDENPLKSKEDWMKLYRRFVRVPANERNLPDGPTVVNGIDVLKNFRPWVVFGLDPKKATKDDVRKAFRRTIIKHHPDQGGDPRVAERLKTMRDSLLALM